MTKHEIAIVRRSLYIERLVQAVLKTHPKWRVDRRSLTPLGLDHVYEVILRDGNMHHLISFDLSSDPLESIRRRFHFAEASFAHATDDRSFIVLTTLPPPDMVEVPEPREIIPFTPEREPSYMFEAAFVIVSLIAAAAFATFFL